MLYPPSPFLLHHARLPFFIALQALQKLAMKKSFCYRGGRKSSPPHSFVSPLKRPVTKREKQIPVGLPVAGLATLILEKPPHCALVLVPSFQRMKNEKKTTEGCQKRTFQANTLLHLT